VVQVVAAQVAVTESLLLLELQIPVEVAAVAP
jgi:hypothetical protein